MKQFSLVIALMVSFSITGFAQKFGHLNTQEVLLNMPERTQAQSTIEARAGEYESELTRMQQDFQTKLGNTKVRAALGRQRFYSRKSESFKR